VIQGCGRVHIEYHSREQNAVMELDKAVNHRALPRNHAPHTQSHWDCSSSTHTHTHTHTHNTLKLPLTQKTHTQIITGTRFNWPGRYTPGGCIPLRGKPIFRGRRFRERPAYTVVYPALATLDRLAKPATRQKAAQTPEQEKFRLLKVISFLAAFAPPPSC
jgi:hypothetical protein